MEDSKSKKKISFNTIGWILCIIVAATLIVFNARKSSKEIEELRNELETTKEEVLMNSVFIDHTRKASFEMFHTMGSLLSLTLVKDNMVMAKIITETTELVGDDCMPEFDYKEIRMKSLDNIKEAIQKLKEDGSH